MSLIRELKNEGIHLLGVVRKNKLMSCCLKDAKDLKKESRGAMDFKVSKEKDICVVRWFDISAVTLASSFAGMEPIDYVRGWSVAEKKFLMICHPACVQVYNEFMGGVDKLDGLISYYCIRSKTKKWPRRVIYHFVDFALANSWLVYRHIEILNVNKKYLDLLSFRNEVADALLKAKLDSPSVVATNPVGRPRLTTASPEELANHQGGNGLSAKRLHTNSDVRLNQFRHFPCAIDALSQRYKIKDCKERSRIKCEKCHVFLCLTNKRNCLKAFHVE